jgi:succinoglycan biosynthesis protein ExoA
VNDELPKITVLIAARPGQMEIKAVQAGRALQYPADRLELIVARGKQPSVQRNAGIKKAQGELIYFLDDDSVPLPSNLKRAVVSFANPSVQMLGGPNCCPTEAPNLERIFALVLGSWLAFGPSRARYISVGQKRTTSEKELILCNLLARRDSLLELGGFNEALYPNEENALMDELQKKGGKLVYDPEFVVYRRPRSTLQSFAKMLFTYGRGRAEQFRLHPTFGSVLNFVPPVFLIYVMFLIVLAFLPVQDLVRLLLHIPLVFYFLILLGHTMGLMKQGGVFRSIAAAPLIVLSHLLYGAGFWRGLFLTRFKPPEQRLTHAEVILEKVL